MLFSKKEVEKSSNNFKKLVEKGPFLPGRHSIFPVCCVHDVPFKGDFQKILRHLGPKITRYLVLVIKIARYLMLSSIKLGYSLYLAQKV